MTTRWAALEALDKHGWSLERERDVLAASITPSLVEANLDLLVRTAARQASTFAEQLLTFALGVLDAGSDASIRLRNLLGVLAANAGNYATARAILDDAHIDAGRTWSSRAAAIRVNLASIAFASGDVAATRRWLAKAGSCSSATGFAAAAVRAAESRLHATRLPLLQAIARLGEAEAVYRAETGSGAPTTLVASATTIAAQFDLAMSQGAIELAEELAERLELLRQRIAAALGADHLDTLSVRLNLSTADFALARASRSLQEASHALAPLSAVANRIEQVLGAYHPLALTAAGNAASARFEYARLARSVTMANSALTAMRTVAENTSRLLGENHPHAMSTFANLATASFELSRSAGAQVEPAVALEALETACERARIVLGTEHATTRVLQHELHLCRQWNDHAGDRGGGGLRTMQRIATDVVFDDEYVSFEQARNLLDAQPMRTRETDPEVAKAWRRYAVSPSRRSQAELVRHYVPIVARSVQKFQIGVLSHVSPLTITRICVQALSEAIESYDAARRGDGFEEHLAATISRVLTRDQPDQGVSQRSWANMVAEVLAGPQEPRTRSLGKHVLDSAVFDAELVDDLTYSRSLTDDPAAIVARRGELNSVAEMIAALRVEERAVIALLYVEGMTISETAAALGMSVSQASTLNLAALTRLRKGLERDS